MYVIENCVIFMNGRRFLFDSYQICLSFLSSTCDTEVTLDAKVRLSQMTSLSNGLASVDWFCQCVSELVLWLKILFNLLRPSEVYVWQQTEPSLVQVVACHLFGAKPVSEPMMIYCQLNPKECISMKYLKFKSFHSRKCIGKYHVWNGSHFVLASMC